MASKTVGQVGILRPIVNRPGLPGFEFGVLVAVSHRRNVGQAFSLRPIFNRPAGAQTTRPCGFDRLRLIAALPLRGTGKPGCMPIFQPAGSLAAAKIGCPTI
jgi:hypothetical protein